MSAGGMLWGGAVFAAAFAFSIGYLLNKWRNGNKSIEPVRGKKD
jgi:hypothetical protein